MKTVLLSADGPIKAYSVPDAVADDLVGYCMRFIDWVHEDPDAEKYRQFGGVCYGVKDFIDYLNERVFPENPSLELEELRCYDRGFSIPLKYRGCPRFNF